MPDDLHFPGTGFEPPDDLGDAPSGPSLLVGVVASEFVENFGFPVDNGSPNGEDNDDGEDGGLNDNDDGDDGGLNNGEQERAPPYGAQGSFRTMMGAWPFSGDVTLCDEISGKSKDEVNITEKGGFIAEGPIISSPVEIFSEGGPITANTNFSRGNGLMHIVSQVGSKFTTLEDS